LKVGSNKFTSTFLDGAGGYLFADPATQSNPGISQFVDFLVGVTGNCNQLGPSTTCSYIPIPNTTFTWTLDNGIIVSKYAPVDLSMEMDISPLAPLGCSDRICGEAISLDDALALTGNTLASFEALGNFELQQCAGTIIACGNFAGAGNLDRVVRETSRPVIPVAGGGALRALQHSTASTRAATIASERDRPSDRSTIAAKPADARRG
jgi:hypothetical protein